MFKMKLFSKIESNLKYAGDKDYLAMVFQNIDFLQWKQRVFNPENLQLITYQ